MTPNEQINAIRRREVNRKAREAACFAYLETLPSGHLSLIRREAKKAGYPLTIILGPTRTYSVCAARNRAIYDARQLGYSLPQLGKIFGFRHHTTILHSIRKEEARRSA